MLQVIQLHPYKSCYPFGLEKQTQNTYVELIKQVGSEQELQELRQNLAVFKLIDSQLIIKLDSYIKQSDQIQMYYQYQPTSIKTYIQQQMLSMPQQHLKDKFLTRMLSLINTAIDNVIQLLSSKHIQALLSIQSMAITDHQKIKFFIQPDFTLSQGNTPRQTQQYYQTQKKKLQIQLQQFLQHIFQLTNDGKRIGNDSKKANFVIQGTRLVFVNNEESNRQSSMAGVGVMGNSVGNANSMSIGSSGSIRSEKVVGKDKAEKQDAGQQQKKFDIKSILDEKKLQKNQSQLQQPHQNQHQPHQKPQQQPPNPPQKRSFTLTQQPQSRQVKNYFQNNDDFNKDASFYPEEFIKQDSIAEFQGYEDELQRELEDLKRKQYEQQLELERNVNSAKNRLSMVPNNGILGGSVVGSNSNTVMGTQASTVSYKYPTPTQNLSNSQEQDTSTEHKQKKKYKVTITTSHQVNVDQGQDFNLHQIQQQIIDDIRKGKLQGSQKPQVSESTNTKTASSKCIPAQNMPCAQNRSRQHPQHQIYTSYPVINPMQNYTSTKTTSMNSIHSREELGEDRPFSKQHPHVGEDKGQSVGGGKGDGGGKDGFGGLMGQQQQQGNGHVTDIKKIIEKIKNNSQVSQPSSMQQKPQPVIQTSPKPPQQFSQQFPGPSAFQQDQHRPHSQLSSQGQTNTQTQQQYDKEYQQKILKAKLKAEEIMKLVKQRKGQ